MDFEFKAMLEQTERIKNVLQQCVKIIAEKVCVRVVLATSKL